MAKGDIGIQIDPRSMAMFQQSLREYRRATSKDEADIINNFGRDVIFRAIQFTPKASAAKKPLGKRYDPNNSGKTNSERTFYKILNKGKKSNVVPHSKAKAVYNRRRSSIGYMKAGWLNAAKDFAIATKRTPPKGRPIPGKDADKGYAKVARPSLFGAKAIAANFADAVDKIGKGPLERAMRFVAISELNYAQRKLGITAEKYSAKTIRKMSI